VLKARVFDTTTPLTRAGRAESARLRHDIRSVHTEASAPAIMQRASAPCAALSGIPGAVCASVVVFTSPPSCPPSLGPVYATRASRDPHPGRIGPMRALTPGELAHPSGLSASFALPSEHPTPTHVACPACRFDSHLSASGRASGPGFASMQQARRNAPPYRVRHPAGCSLASDCSPPHIAVTRLSSAT